MSGFTGKKDYFWFYFPESDETHLFRQSSEEIDYESQLQDDAKRAIEDFYDMISIGDKSVTEAIEFLMLDLEKLRTRSDK